MKKKSEKKLSLGKIKIARMSKPDQHLIQGGGPPPTAPIICNPTVFGCRSNYFICDKVTATIKAQF